MRDGVTMAIDAVNQVAAAEKQAEEKVSACQAAASKSVADAARSGKEALDNAILNAEAEVRALIKQAEKKAANTAMEITARAEGECEKLRILASGRMDKAAAFIVEKVVKR